MMILIIKNVLYQCNPSCVSYFFVPAANFYVLILSSKSFFLQDDHMTAERLEIARAELPIAEFILPYVEADPLQSWRIEGDFYSFNAELIRKKN